MGKISKPRPVNLLTGVLTSTPELFLTVKDILENHFGPIDLKSDIFPFYHFTEYYNTTMGKGILRQFYSFERLITPDEIASIKLKTNSIEEMFASMKEYHITRPVNIDPGYINESRLILVSTKDFSHRIYLRDGIYGEVTLSYRDGRYEPFPWTFPDYRSTSYHCFFKAVRTLFRKKLRDNTYGKDIDYIKT